VQNNTNVMEHHLAKFGTIKWQKYILKSRTNAEQGKVAEDSTSIKKFWRW